MTFRHSLIYAMHTYIRMDVKRQRNTLLFHWLCIIFSVTILGKYRVCIRLGNLILLDARGLLVILHTLVYKLSGYLWLCLQQESIYICIEWRM